MVNIKSKVLIINSVKTIINISPIQSSLLGLSDWIEISKIQITISDQMQKSTTYTHSFQQSNNMGHIGTLILVPPG